MLPIQIQNIIVLEEEERREYIRQFNMERRIMREDSDPFTLDDALFKDLFRLNKEMIHYLLVNLLPHMESNHIAAIEPRLKIFVTLYFFATGSYQRTIGQSWNFSISQQSVSRCINEVSNLIVSHLAPDWIVFPDNPNTINTVKAKFMTKTRFPGVLGAIDCTHISIIAPVVEEHNYLNRKGYHSKNVQIVSTIYYLII